MDFTIKFITKEELPLVIEPKKNIQKNELKDFLKNNIDFLKKSLLQHGGLLFRHFPISDENDFSHLIEGLDVGNFINYIGGDSPRNKIREGIYTSTEAPPWIKIPLHNELSFVSKYPKYISFYCHIAPQERGETIIGDARKIYQSIDQSVRERFINKGLKYSSCYYHKNDFIKFIAKNAHKSWVDVFETHNKRDVERLCKEHDFQFQWNKNDWLKISQIRPATIVHPITHQTIWFNQAHLYDFNPKFLGWWRYLGVKLVYCRKHTRLHEVSFADANPIPRADLYHIMDVLDANTVSFPWQRGDVLVLDNISSMHGRATFTGKRRILTAMTG